MEINQKAKKCRVQFLEWMGHRSTRVILLDIGPHGASILMGEKPVLDRPIWIRLVDAVKSDWLEAIPIRYGESHEVEIHFKHPCPLGFLRAATHVKGFRLVEDRDETRIIGRG
jgi:hypothetical protein